MSQDSALVMPELPEAARCAGCGYCLRGSTVPRCPECGRAFDVSEILRLLSPVRDEVIKVPPTKKEWRILLPPGWREWTLVVLAVVWMGWLTSGEELNDVVLMFAAVPSASILFLMLIDLERIHGIIHSCIIPPGLEVWHWKRRLKLAAPLVILTMSVWTPWPPVIRFWVSKPMLDRFALQVIAQGEAPDQRVGLYETRYARRIGNGMNFRLGNWNDNCGLEYIRPALKPARAVTYRHLGGNWYSFEP